MIVVAASDQNDGLASFSSYGAQSVDLAAPGVDILSSFAEAQAGSLATVTASNVTYSALELEYSGRTAAGSPVGGDIIDCGVGYSANFPAAVKGNIALISRGTLNFSAKVLNAMNAGAAAAVIYNNASGNFSGTLGSSGQWIPAVSISQADGLAIKAALPLRGSVANAADPSAIYQYLSGTSMATPMVSGAVAFAAINFPNETVTQRVHRIVSSVDAVASLSGRVASGGRLNLQKVVDTDLNGLPDWWEQAHFGVSSGTDPNGDPDHDGANNLAEWLAGTDPTNPRSCLSLNATLTAQGALIAWPSVSGKYYRVDRAYALGSFAPIATNILATAPLNQILDSATRSNAAFYRVVLEP
jgi:subtilisin family serine protease